MAGSQLKRLKASLRDQGVIGPQKSKKQKRENARKQKANDDRRIKRAEALATIRDQFNPFQFKTNARGPKFEVTTDKPVNEKSLRGIMGRPGMARSAGEEKRRQTLLVEMQRRNKVGGLVDRRFGENDANISAEDKMMERFVREKLRTHKKSAVFNLEDDEPEDGRLTHMGQPLMFDDALAQMRDDFDEDDMSSGDASDTREAKRALKRARLEDAAAEETGADGQPEMKKTKKEVYEEIIAKSKAHKMQRQLAKEADDDLRLEIDKELPQVHALMLGLNKAQPKVDADTTELIAGMDRETLGKDYDVRVKKLLAEKRAQPAEKTKTEEEVAEEAARKLQELEQQRIRRMKGIVGSDSEEDEDGDENEDEVHGGPGEAGVASKPRRQSGSGTGIKMRATATDLGLDDEDDFLIEADLVASGSELDLDEEPGEDESESHWSEEGESDPEDDDFTKGLLNESESKDLAFHDLANARGNDSDGVRYTFPCPQTHGEFLTLVKDVEASKLAVVIQRIRALHHPRLDRQNKERLGSFARILVQHIAHLGKHSPDSRVLEMLIRHVHSLAKTFPVEVGREYREMLKEAESSRPLGLDVSDLIILTGIGTTFPTSDHFHQVVTPAMLCIGRYLGQKVPQTLADYAIGLYLVALVVQYHQLAKRYVPEAINFALNVCALGPVKARERLGLYPHHEPPAGLRIQDASHVRLRRLDWNDCQAQADMSTDDANSLKAALLGTTLSALQAAAELWAAHPAFLETFQPVLRTLEHLSSPPSRQHLPAALAARLGATHGLVARLAQVARLARRPLELHHHRPRAVRTVAPRWDDGDGGGGRARDEPARLRAELRRERKGAVRELRRDASFVARENLRRKRAQDDAYAEKYRRLVTEIQNEEGRAANEYEREKKKRQRRR